MQTKATMLTWISRPKNESPCEDWPEGRNRSFQELFNWFSIRKGWTTGPNVQKPGIIRCLAMNLFDNAVKYTQKDRVCISLPANEGASRDQSQLGFRMVPDVSDAALWRWISGSNRLSHERPVLPSSASSRWQLLGYQGIDGANRH